MKRLLLIFLLTAAALRAVTVTTSYGGATATATLTFETSDNKWHLSWALSPAWTGPSGNPPLAQMYVTNLGTSSDVWAVTSNNTEGHGISGSTAQNTGAWGTNLRVSVRVLDYPSFASHALQTADLNYNDGNYRVGPFVNTMNVPVRVYAIDHTDGTTVLGYQEVIAGGTVDFTVVVPNGHAVDVKLFVKATLSGDNTWVESDSFTSGTATVLASNQAATPAGGTPPATAPSLATVAAPMAAPPSTTNNNSTIWNVTNVNASTTTATALDKATFREGITQLMNKDKADRDAWTANKAADYAATTAAKNSQGVTAMHDLLDGKAVVTADDEPTSPTNLTVALPKAAKGESAFTVDVSPWNVSEVLEGAAIIKPIIAALVCLFYLWFCIGEVQNLMRGIMIVPQARGNTVAGSAGQITGLLAAGLLTVILLAAPTVLAALFETTLGWGTPQKLFGNVGGLTWGGTVIKLFYTFLPVATIVSAITSVIVLRVAGVAIFTGVSLAIKWVQFVIVFGLVYVGTSDAKAAINMRGYGEFGSGMTVSVTSDGGMTSNFSQYVSDGDQLFASFDPAGRSAYDLVIIDDNGKQRQYAIEVLDGGTIAVNPLAVSVSHPASVWWGYFATGFKLGMLWELVGLGYRLFRHLPKSTETG